MLYSHKLIKGTFKLVVLYANGEEGRFVDTSSVYGIEQLFLLEHMTEIAQQT